MEEAEGSIQEHPKNSGHPTDDPQLENFNDDGWASFTEVHEKEQVERVSHHYGK